MMHEAFAILTKYAYLQYILSDFLFLGIDTCICPGKSARTVHSTGDILVCMTSMCFVLLYFSDIMIVMMIMIMQNFIL